MIINKTSLKPSHYSGLVAQKKKKRLFSRETIAKMQQASNAHRINKLRSKIVGIAKSNIPVKYSDLDPAWIDIYKREAKDSRKLYLEMTLKALGRCEGVRKVLLHLERDYGMPYKIDYELAVSAIMKSLSVELFVSTLPETLSKESREKLIESYIQSQPNRADFSEPYRLMPADSPFKKTTPSPLVSKQFLPLDDYTKKQPASRQSSPVGLVL